MKRVNRSADTFTQHEHNGYQQDARDRAGASRPEHGGSNREARSDDGRIRWESPYAYAPTIPPPNRVTHSTAS